MGTPRKKKREEPANGEEHSIASMKFWSRLKNPPPVLAFAFPEDPDNEEDFEDGSLDPLLNLPKVPVDESVVHSLRISLVGARPQVWRRVLVKSITLESLHEVIQIAMGWEDYHLHAFEIGDNSVPLVDEGAEIDEREILVSQLFAAQIMQTLYVYDFGDDWRHTVTIEKSMPAKAGVNYPQCVAGKGACPVEDCGGIETWSRFLQSLRHPDLKRGEEIDDLLERLGDDYQPHEFDLESTNKLLQRAFKKSRRRKTD